MKSLNETNPTNTATNFATSTEDMGIDLWEYLRIMRRRWLLILLTVAVVVGLTAFVSLRMTKIYRATTTLQIETQAPQVLGKNVEDVVEMGTGSFWSNAEYYETQYRIIESRSVATRVVNEFKLHEDPIFMGVPPEQRAAFKPVSLNEASEVLQSLLTVEPVKSSRLVLIHVNHPDPARAQLYSNSIAKAYVDQNLETMLQSTVDAVDWLSDQLDTARQELVSSDQTLRSYKRDHDILSISLEDKQNLISSQMTAIAIKLTESQAKKVEIRARKIAISNAAKTNDPMAVPVESLNNNPLIQQLKQKHADLSQDYGELSSKYGKNFPSMVELKAKIAMVKQNISREVNNIITSANAELKAAQATEVGLKKILEDLRNRAQDLADMEIGYKDLARDSDNNESIYQLLLGRSKEADLSRLLRVNNVEILDTALLPEAPIKPRVKLNILISLLLGLVLSVVLAVLVEFADRTIKTQEDVENLGVSFLGIVPSIDSSSTHGGKYNYDKKKRKIRKKATKPAKPTGEINYDIFVHDHPKSQVAESLRSIRTNLLFMTADKTVKRLLVTSPSPQEGKTTVAINLGIVMAQSGSRVLLIDTDMRRPRVHKAFNIVRPRKGLSTMILGETTAEESIIKSEIPNMDILVCGPTPPNPSELLHTESFTRVIDQISQMYDRIIFDSPPVGVVTDAAILSKMVDGTLLILKSLQTTRDSAKHGVNVLKDIDSEIFGAVLNDLDLNNRKYGQHYYYYYKKYGYYYGESDA